MKKAKIDYYCNYCGKRHILIINLPFPVRVFCPCCGAHEDLNYDYECIIIDEYDEKPKKVRIKK